MREAASRQPKDRVECLRVENTYDTIVHYETAHFKTGLTPWTLLLLEDTPSDTALAIEMVTQGLPDFDWEFHAVGRAEDAIVLTRNYQFHAALIDLSVEDFSGIAVIDILQKHAPFLPIIVLTGTCDTTTLRAAASRQVSSILHKKDLSAPRMRQIFGEVLGLPV